MRLRRPDDRSTAEIDALSDASGCPGVPRLLLLSHNLLVLDFMPGAPRDLNLLGERQCAALTGCLACIHAIEYEAYNPWPAFEFDAGSRAELFQYRRSSLVNYDSYTDACAGRIHPALPDLFDRLDGLDLASPSWKLAEFSRLHGDLSHGNILWDDDADGPGLIDWEYSRVGDPAEDFAYLLTEQPGGVALLSRLTTHYIEAGGADDVAHRVPAYGLFAAVDSALWWADYGARESRSVDDELASRIESARQWLPLI